MANNNYRIFYCDASSSAQTSAITALNSAGAVEQIYGGLISRDKTAYVDTYYIESQGGYAIFNIDNCDLRTSGMVADNGYFFITGLQGSDGVYRPYGVLDINGNAYAEGALQSGGYMVTPNPGGGGLCIWSTYSNYSYDYGIVDRDGYGHSPGIFNLDMGGSYVASSGILDPFYGYGEWHAQGIYGSFNGPLDYNATGLMHGDSYGNPIYETAGLLAADGTFAFTGILNSSSEYMSRGVVDETGGSLFVGIIDRYGSLNSEGVIEADGTANPLDAIYSTPYLAGYAAAPKSDILGTGLL